jgi:hypothetical protein
MKVLADHGPEDELPAIIIPDSSGIGDIPQPPLGAKCDSCTDRNESAMNAAVTRITEAYLVGRSGITT